MQALTKAFFKKEIAKSTDENLMLTVAQLSNEFPGYTVLILKAFGEVAAARA